MGLGSPRRTALVLGAAGFLGSHLVDRLLAEDYEVIGVDNLMTGDLANLRRASVSSHFHFEVGDVREKLPVYADLVFNLACPASPEHYQSDPHATFTSSVLGALRLVEYARGRRVRIIHTSTSEIYGDPLEHPQTELYWGNVNPLGARACYDEGKRAAETVFADARRAGLDVRIARIFNTYGPRMALRDGRVVSNFILQAVRHEDITIYGDGSQTRSFCFVDDMIEGLYRLATVRDFDPLVVNLGNPHELTVLELADLVRRISGKGLKVIFGPLPSDDPRRRCPDITRARELLRFEPKVPVGEGLLATYLDFGERA